MKKIYNAPMSAIYSMHTEGMIAESLRVTSSDADCKITNNNQFLSNKNQGGPWANMNND